jgi:hypothetical protein
MTELSAYVFSPLREGDFTLFRGGGNGLAPVLLVTAANASPVCVKRLEREYALRAELDLPGRHGQSRSPATTTA